jgi:predicted small metal-binding protein
MAQHFITCRDFIDDGDCSVLIGADTLEELVETAVEHAHCTHAEEDTPTLRAYIRQNIRDAAAV